MHVPDHPDKRSIPLLAPPSILIAPNVEQRSSAVHRLTSVVRGEVKSRIDGRDAIRLSEKEDRAKEIRVVGRVPAQTVAGSLLRVRVSRSESEGNERYRGR